MPQSQWNEVWCSLDGLASQIESAWFIRIWVGLLLFQSLESYDFPPPLAFQPEARNAIVSACSCKSWRIHHSSSSSLVYLRTTYTFVGFNEERATRILSFLHRTIAFGVGGSLRRRTIKTTLLPSAKGQCQVIFKGLLLWPTIQEGNHSQRMYTPTSGCVFAVASPAKLNRNSWVT